MTTVVWKDGIMAADSQINGRGTLIYHTKKIFAINTMVIGVSGDTHHWDRFLRMFRDNKYNPFCVNSEEMRADRAWLENNIKETNALVFDTATSQLGFMYEGHVTEVDPSIPYAIGSGMDVALGAVWAGASAIRAVEIGILLDNASGGTVDHIDTGWRPANLA